MATAQLAQAVAELGLSLTPSQLDQLAAYRDLLVERAGEFNLTAVRDPAGVERRHLLESLALGVLLNRLGLLSAARCIDVGSGAGLPGLPLAIAWRTLELTLLAANEKRCAFLREAVAALALTSVTVVAGRAESVAHDVAHRCQYDLALARAVAPLPVLLEYCVPFLKDGGHLVAQKGEALDRELVASPAALAALGATVESIESFRPPAGRPQRVVVVRKTGPTPANLPRRVGVPAHRPLG